MFVYLAQRCRPPLPRGPSLTLCGWPHGVFPNVCPGLLKRPRTGFRIQSVEMTRVRAWGLKPLSPAHPKRPNSIYSWSRDLERLDLRRTRPETCPVTSGGRCRATLGVASPNAEPRNPRHLAIPYLRFQPSYSPFSAKSPLELLAWG